MRANTLFFFSLSCSLHLSSEALRLPFKRTTVYDKRDVGAGISKVSAVSKANTADQISLTTSKDFVYMGNVTIGGSQFTVQLDTGSSDLWVATQDAIADSVSSPLTHNMTYGIGYAYGNIAQAPVSFAGISVQSQAYILATQANNPVSSYGAQGILGLGFTRLSQIDSTVNKSGASWGRSFLYNAFQSDTSTPNFISIALQRSDDPSNDVQGALTIGEYASGLEAVQNMPSISTFPANNPSRWSVLLDALFINGGSHDLTSAVKSSPSGKSVVVLDSGSSYSYVDPNLAKAMYGGISGATLDTSSGTWSVPCDAEVDITLAFGGKPYPLHPLDVVDNDISGKGCVGTFLGQSLSITDGEFDYLFGDNVLRSLYTVYDFGDFGSNGQMGNPYVKLLSVTNATAASVDFHAQRGGTPNTTISASGVDVNGTTIPDSSTSQTASLSTDSDSKISKLLDYMPVLLGILAFNSLVLLGLAICAAMYFVRRGKGKGMRGPGGAAARADYHYTRVRSQFDPKEVSAPPTPNEAANAATTSRASVRGSVVPSPSRHGSSPSVHTLGNKNPGTPDEPFTPPQQSDHHEDDLTNASLVHPEDEHSQVPMPSQSPGPSAVTFPTNPYDPAFIAPVPRPRFVSSTSTGSVDPYARPQSLFSMASSPLLNPGNAASRPMSSYDIPLGAAPRARFSSAAMSEGRPDSTFSTSPLVPRGAAPDFPGGDHPSPHEEQDDPIAMAPPRPRFMSDVNANPRPDSTLSVGSGSSSPLRPQSRFMDVSGQRPFSEAN